MGKQARAIVDISLKELVSDLNKAYADEWLAFEADGFYHFTAKRRAYDAQRDEDLKKRFDLPVVRLSGVEVKRLYKELVEEGGDANGLRATSPNRSNG